MYTKKISKPEFGLYKTMHEIALTEKDTIFVKKFLQRRERAFLHPVGDQIKN